MQPQSLAVMAPKTIKDCVESLTPHIGEIKNEQGETTARATVIYLIAELLEYFSIGKTMGETQMAQTADLIIQEKPYLKPEDLKLCFNKAKMGKYGPIYDRIDGQIIFEWLNKHEDERMQYSESKSIIAHQTRERQQKDVPICEDVKSSLKELAKRLKDKERKEQQEKFAKRPKSVANRAITMFFNQFNEAYNKLPLKEQKNPRFIFRSGKWMSEEDFLEHKLKRQNKLLNHGKTNNSEQ